MPIATKNSVNFTKAEIDRLKLPQNFKSSYMVFHDSTVDGLVLLLYPSGAKTFYVYKRSQASGKPIRTKLGKYPDMSIEQARKAALSMLHEIVVGLDPQAKKAALKKEATLSELFDHYIENYASEHCKTWKETQKNFNRYFADYLNRKPSTFTMEEVQGMVHTLGRERSIHVANRAFEDLRAVLNHGIKFGFLTGKNPCEGVVRYKTQPRKRFIKPHEFERFLEVLKEQTNIAFRDYVYLSLFTGARQANVLSMQWDHIDFSLGHWNIPGEEKKNSEPQTVPLTSLALQVLVDRHAIRTSNKWVFPSDSASGHYVEPKEGWRQLLKKAKMENLRMHDLRRTLGSYMAMNNQSLHIIGAVLGHKSSASTAIYSHFAHDPLRHAMEAAISTMIDSKALLPEMQRRSST